MADNPLRLKNLFDGTNVGENRNPYGNLFPSGPMPVSEPEPANDISQLRTYPQEDAALNRFNARLQEFPQHEAPTGTDRVTAGLMGVSDLLLKRGNGIDTQEKIFHGDHERQIADWQKEIQPLEVASSQENQRNINSRNLAALEVKERNDTRRLDEAERKNRAAEASRAIRDAATTAKANGFEINVEGDRVMATNPVTLKRVDLGPSGSMDERDKLILTGSQAQTRADTMAAAAQTRTETNVANRPGSYFQTADPTDPTKQIIVQMVGPVGYPTTVAPAGTPVPTPAPASARTSDPSASTGVGMRTTPTMPGGQVLPTEAPPDGVQPQAQNAPMRDMFKVGVQPPPAEMGAIRAMAAETLSVLENEILDMSSLDKTDANGKPVPPKLRPEVNETVGASRLSFGRWNPTSDAAAGEAAMKTFHDRLVLDLIGKMKSQSKTGATGFGQLTGPELDLLINASSKLSNWYINEDKYLIPELMKIRDRLKKVMLPPGDQTSVTSAIPPIYERNKETGEMRVSTDNGKTWKPFRQ